MSEVGPNQVVKSSTVIRVGWRGLASLLKCGRDAESYRSLWELAQDFAAFNPHTRFTVIAGGKRREWTATQPEWRKWRTCDQTSAHWYDTENLTELIGAYVRVGQRRTVRDFVGEFAGLSGTQKRAAVSREAGLAEMHLDDLVSNGRVDPGKVERLLASMKGHSRLVKPQRLGILGQEHVVHAIQSHRAAGIHYARQAGTDENGLPYVLEVGFGVKGDGPRKLLFGLNHSRVINVPSQHLWNILANCHVQVFDPVVVFVHQTTPRLSFTDQGKGTINNSARIEEVTTRLLTSVTKDFAKEKRRAARRERQDELSAVQVERLRSSIKKYSEKQRIKKAAYAAMPEAYRRASEGIETANARQVMYQARPLVLKATGGKCWKNSSYFTQVLLPDYQKEHEEECAHWDITFDARGHLREPHVVVNVDLGTVGVRNYVASWQDGTKTTLESPPILDTHPTCGPMNRYKYALFIEKEGFDTLLARAGIAENYDIAIFSSKGMSTSATRMLVDKLSQAGVTVLVAHDFDRAGFLIRHYLSSDSRRHRFAAPPRVIDLGLRLVDVKRMGLQSEPVEYSQNKNPGSALAQVAGITGAEINFLIREHVAQGRWRGERVELNAMTSRQFIDWLEARFRALGVIKVIPDKDTLQHAYRRAVLYACIRRAAEQLTEQARDERIEPPPDLNTRIAKLLRAKPFLSWDEALNQIVSAINNQSP